MVKVQQNIFYVNYKLPYISGLIVFFYLNEKVDGVGNRLVASKNLLFNISYKFGSHLKRLWGTSDLKEQINRIIK